MTNQDGEKQHGLFLVNFTCCDMRYFYAIS